MQDAVTRILATIISGMGQQAGGYVAVPARMQMAGMNGVPAQPVRKRWKNYWSCLISRYLMM